MFMGIWCQKKLSPYLAMKVKYNGKYTFNDNANNSDKTSQVVCTHRIRKGQSKEEIIKQELVC